MTDENMGGADGGAPEGQATPEAQGGAGTPAPEGQVDWSQSLPDDLKGYVANKGWDSPEKIAQSYRELEKFAGSKANYVELPDPSNADAVKAVMQKLGAPSDISGYEINLPEGTQADDNMMGSFKQFALDNNMTKAQAQAAVEWFESYKGQAGEAAQAAMMANSEQAIADLKREWGRDFDRNVAAGQKLVRQVGISTEEIAALEGQFDTPTVMNLMAKLGARLGDNTLIGEDAGEGNGFGVTPQQASAKIQELGADKAFRQRLYDPTHIGHKSAVAEMQRLQEIAAGAR